jgi:hypothetical protein
MKPTLAQVRLRLDVVSMKIFVWMFSSDLADYHRQQGRIAKAERLAAIAEAYFQAPPGDDEPPKAAAMAMPVPLPMTSTNAVSATPVKKVSSERSRLVPSLTS